MGSATYGLVPYANSTYGSVIETRDLFANQQERFPSLTICLETYLNVSHYLLGHRKLVSGTSRPFDLDHVKCIYSHPAALGQCKIFLDQHMKGVECREISSTSKAAETVSQDPTRASAAIASKTAAKLFDLSFLAEEVQDRRDNITRFLFLRRRTSKCTHFLEENISSKPRKYRMKTLITFSVNPSKAGRLSDALKVFTTLDLNLTNFFSVPSTAGADPWQDTYFAEFDQKQEPNGEEKVNQALAKLEALTTFCKWHGNWPSST